MKKTLVSLTSLVAGLVLSNSASAAFINIDDSDLDFITITAGDFDGGFFINDVLLTTGLGNSNSITLGDEGYSIYGEWFDNGLADGSSLDLSFALAGNASWVTSGIEFSVGNDGFLANLFGSFGAYQSPEPYFFNPLPTYLQNGQTVVGSVPSLAVSFTSEAIATPEPASIAIFGLGLAGLGLARRRQ